MILHPWHEADPGDQWPQITWAFIEISRGSRAKYEIDKTSGLLKLDRVLHSSVHYPTNYGFIPKTLQLDGDPLDILVLCQEDIVPHCLVEVRIIGVMQMVDQGIVDDKIIGVALKDKSVSHINEIEDLPPYIEQEIMHFFETYTVLEGKKVSTRKLQNKEKAFSIIQEAIDMYQKKFKS